MSWIHLKRSARESIGNCDACLMRKRLLLDNPDMPQIDACPHEVSRLSICVGMDCYLRARYTMSSRMSCVNDK